MIASEVRERGSALRLSVSRELSFFGDPFVFLVSAFDAVVGYAVDLEKKPRNFIRSAGCIDRGRLFQMNEFAQLELVRGHGSF
jgi:hypothetical protein